jgi:hypothetical protein
MIGHALILVACVGLGAILLRISRTLDDIKHQIYRDSGGDGDE